MKLINFVHLKNTSMQPYRRLLFFLFVPFLAVGLFSCEESELAPDEPRYAYLIDYELLDTFESSQLRAFIALFDPNIKTNVIRYDVDIYRVTYLTDFQGDETEASGLICMPAEARIIDFPFFLGFHASISSQQESPSNFSNPLGTGLEFFASLGYITVIPDYLGFGRSSQLFHPYLVRESVTQVSADMVRAATEMMMDLEQSYEQEIYLTGYSQGGYNAVAMHYAMEDQSLLPTWKVGGTAAGGGTYDLGFLTRQTLINDTYGSPEVLAYLIWSYHNYYGMEGGAEQYFLEPYASRIPALFDGSNPLGEIKRQLTPDLNLLLQPGLLTALRNNQAHPILEKLKQNSIPAWAAESPINLLHSPQDEVIGSTNSTKFLEQMELTGSRNIIYTPLQASGHREAAVPMLINTIFWLENIRMN